ncbi:translation elongation factor Ts [Candidatus Protochlamydia phocaeensis]|uniref:translation elongation factor Ts n=1 Tax=Candidatus Protochlamydia phocaeensis TaxID=1414722 RepID=UPI000838B071|nr:translation elongation factor Ts [Candidatus Protochlamydia phocaeensis]
MTAVTPAMIKELRERTGVGMGKCKEALEEAKGDMELAIANLRKAGMATAVKKEGRETKEGMIGTAEGSNAIAVVEVNAETDFVVKNDRFKQFLENIAEEAVNTNPPSLDAFLQQKYSKEPSLTIDQYRATIVQTIGENIQIKRILMLKKSPDRSLGVYSHLGGKIVTVVELTGSNQEGSLAKDIAMHTAAAAPEYLSPETVPQEIIANEKDIAKGQIQGKPANIVDKIVEGKISAFYDAHCLVRQKYIKDDTITIADLVNKRAKEVGKPLTVSNFIRWNVGQ